MRTYFIRSLIILLISGLGLESARAQSTDQNYPVSASAFVAAQPNQNLSAYFSSSQAMSVTLLLKDLTKPSLQVYLKWSIEGPGVRVASMEGYIPPGLLLLDMGVLRRFSGLELQRDYFRNNVIEEQGLGGSALRTNLPEGFYTFRVQAMEAGTGRQVSNIAETYFSITTPLPPVINLPFNGAVLRQAQDDGSVTLSLSKSPQIQWMPRHYKQAGNTTTYDLKVCKVPDGYEPQEALDACVNPIIDDKANPGTFYPSNTGIGNSIIGAFDPSTPLGMTIGARYAVRVTVHEFDQNGDEVVFANEGRSEVVWFRYGSPCISPESFTIKEIGPGRVQLSWTSQADNKDYKVHYRLAGSASWTTQNVTGISTTVSGLSHGTYEFAVKSSCTDVFPRTDVPANIQAFELSDDEQDDLIPALADPLNTIVTVSGTGIPYVIDSLHSVLDVIKIPCASQISTYESCEADLPVVSPVGVVTPGTKPLPSLSAGDVLSVYDMTVIVTSAGNGAGGFSGTGLARLPFMESTMVSVEFDGVQAWAPQEAGVPGGCVYQVNGYFRTKALSAEELARQQAGLVATLNNPKDSTAFTGTLSDALKKYDDGVTTTDLSRYTAAVLQGSQTIADALDDAVDEYSDPRLIHISTKLDSLMQVLQTNDSLMKVTGEVIRIDNLTGIYTDLFQKLEELKNEGKPDNPVYAISNVQVSNVDDESARISWQAEGTVSRYVIEYRDADGGVLQETVTGTQLNLLRLRADMEYRYRILAYYGDELVASYGEDVFKTTGKFVPVPVNLAYTRIDDNAVSITWDPDAQHNRFKIRYEDKNGEIRYVYPTTNTAVLDGLDPERFHDYEIVAYNQESLESGPANARVTTKEECKLGVRVENRLSIPSLEGNIHLLTATGCFTSDFKQVDGYPKVSWTNGTPGTVGANGVITFSDGEKAEISTGDIPFIGADRVLVVNPTTSKTYTAICQMSQTAQLCTYSVNVKISSAECEEGDFRIEASVDGQTYQTGDITASADGHVNLRAISCPGQIIWNNALGNQENIRMLVNDAIGVSAQCIQATKTCFSNSILVKSEREQECPEILLENTSVDDGFLRLSTNRKAWLFTTGSCKGETEWSVEGDAKLEHTTTKDNKNEVNHIKENVIVYAKCLGSSCPKAKIDVQLPLKKCNKLNVVASISQEPPVQAILKIEKGEAKFKIDNEYKNSHVIPIVPYRIYNITFENGCTFNKEVRLPLPVRFVRGRYDASGKPSEAEVSIKEDFYDLTDLPKYWSIDLLAENCDGKVLWTNNIDENFKLNNNHIRFGSEVPLPTTTTTYYATCFSPNGVATPYSRQITIINNSNQCVNIVGPESIRGGENLKLIAEGCLGNVKWSRYDGSPFSSAITIYDFPTSKDNGTGTEYLPNFTISYKLDCDYPVCSATKEVSVYEPTCSINVDQDKSSTKPGDEITLKASGCGTTIWSLAGNSLVVGSQIKISPAETIKIIASCRGTRCVKEIEIKVPAILPPKIICETLEPYASPNQIYKGESNTINLTAGGCEGGITIWNGPGLQKDSKGQGRSQLVIAEGVTDKAKYTVKCTKDVVGDTEAEIEVKSALRLDLTATPSFVKKGETTTLIAKGCPGGTISWTGFNKSCQSPCNLENQVINEPTEFEAICVSGAEKVTKKIKVLIKTDPSGPSGKDYEEIHSAGCNSFSAYVYPEDINVVEYPYPPKTRLKLTTSGCPANGNVTWETWDRVSISGNTHSPNETTTYVAKCTVNGSSCAEAYRTIDIVRQFDCDDFWVTYENKAPGMFEFFPTGCPSSNSELKWTWYKKDGSSSSENTYKKGDLLAFEYRCMPDKNNPKQICYFTYKYSEDNETIIAYPGVPFSFSGRIGADTNPVDVSQVTESVATVIPCQQEYPMTKLMASYFTTYACAFLENYTGADGKLSAEEAQEFLNKLKQAISAEPDLQKYNLDFSKVTINSIVEAFERGNCEAVGPVLGQAAQGTASVDTYNNDIRPTFANVAKALGGKITNCNSPLAATSRIIYGASPIGSNTVLALWKDNSSSASHVYRLKAGFEIIQGRNIFTILSVPEGVSDKWIGEYVAYFDAEAPNDFIGFYKDIQGGTCTTKYRRLLFGNCGGLCEEGFLPKNYYEMVVAPLILSATATDATCAADNGSINLKATGGVAPYQFSLDGTSFQESPIFTKLEAGSYTLTVKDSKNTVATATAIIREPETYLIETSNFQTARIAGLTTPNARTTEDGYISTQFDETSRKTTFKLKAGFDLKQFSSGVWELTVTSNDPEEKKLAGKYRPYFNACNHSLFVGFYKEDYTGQPCTNDKHIDLQGKRYCTEAWLPESVYSEILKNIMIFANGYRFYGKGAAGILLNSPKEYNETNNLITSDAINRYWSKESIAEEDQTDMDIEFVARRKPDVVYYADGHHSITTSNHNVANDVNRSMSEKFAPGIIGSMLAQANMAVSTIEEQFIYILSAMAADGYTVFEADKPVILKSIEEFRKKHKDILNCSGNPACVVLDTEPNDAGFKTRWENGKIAASDLLVRMASTKRPPNAKVIYNIDIVAHSMGFAYAQGMIEALKSHNNITWGSYYIIAPENGCSAAYGKVDPSQWKEQLWQYGSNLGQGDPDPLWNQDGVAPQCPVTGLTDQSRAFIPATYGNGNPIPKGYLESHSISNYGWIFSIENPQTPGYVTPK